MNWMTLFKPAISYRLSVSEPPSSRASFPGDREAQVALLHSGLDAPGKVTDRGHLGQRPWVGLDPSLLGAREPAPLGGWFLGAARHFSSQGSGQALGPPGRLHLRHQACPLGPRFLICKVEPAVLLVRPRGRGGAGRGDALTGAGARAARGGVLTVACGSHLLSSRPRP